MTEIPERASSGIWMQHRVSYGETDTMGVLYYAEYLHLFERGRNAFIRAFGASYKEFEDRGFFLPVREAKCRYRSPARYDNLLNLLTMLPKWGRASVNFHYRIYNEDRGLLLAEGFTEHACVDGRGKPVALPAWFKANFDRLPES